MTNINFKKIYEAIGKGLKIALNNKDENLEYIDYIFELESLDKQFLAIYNRTPLKKLSIRAGFGFPDFINHELNEAATFTYSVEDTIKLASKRLGFIDYGHIKAIKNANGVKTMVLAINKFDNVEYVKMVMESFGWSFAISYEYDKIDDIPIIMLEFDPIFQDAINDEIKQHPILFHWTPEYRLPLILENGLIPKSDNYLFSYPPKIHLLKGNIDEKNTLYIGKSLCDSNKDILNNGIYVLLNVDTTKVNKDIYYFYDPRYEFGYYTKDTINKEALSKNTIKNFKIS